MAIDGIGSKPPPRPDLGSGKPPVGSAQKPASAFDLGRAESPEGAGRAGSLGSSAVVGGAPAISGASNAPVDPHAYVEARVQEATAHLVGKVAPAQLESIKDVLRERLLGGDPVLAHLAQRAGVTLPSESGEA